MKHVLGQSNAKLYVQYLDRQPVLREWAPGSWKAATLKKDSGIRVDKQLSSSSLCDSLYKQG